MLKRSFVSKRKTCKFQLFPVKSIDVSKNIAYFNSDLRLNSLSDDLALAITAGAFFIFFLRKVINFPKSTILSYAV